MTVIEGPVEGGRGRPFGSPPGPLPEGYVMEEFLLDGTATSFHLVDGAVAGIDGHWEVEPSGHAPFRTRMYVVRPSDPETFNGVVLASWQNVTAGVDLGTPPREAYRGYAWVGITTQRVAIEGQPALGGGISATAGLPAADPDRYGTLHHPGDAFSYDLFSQAARLIAPGRQIGSVDPLGGLEPRTILALGGSQSAMRLGSYLNLAHQRDQIFDAFLLSVHWGMCPKPPDQSLMESFMPTGDGLTGGSSRIRDDSGTPVLVLCSESEVLNMYPVRQADSGTFRHWEMAGTAHAAGAAFDEMVAASGGVDLAAGLGDLVRNELEWDYVADAALRHLVRWAEDGEEPPTFPLVDVDGGSRPAIRRDDWGNATGGLRIPAIEAATGAHRGANEAGVVAALLGETVPFTREQLAARYPTREAYLAVWDAAVDALLAAGLDLGPDEARVRTIGRTNAERLLLAP